jgi:hypothetical protein
MKTAFSTKTAAALAAIVSKSQTTYTDAEKRQIKTDVRNIRAAQLADFKNARLSHLASLKAARVTFATFALCVALASCSTTRNTGNGYNKHLEHRHTGAHHLSNGNGGCNWHNN